MYEVHIDKIKYFIDLVECRNFTETAKRNFVSQTTISQHIAALEREFNLTLIDRKQIPIEPTQAGWMFYGEALVLWKQYNHMRKRAKHFQQDHTLILSIEYSTLTDIQSILTFIPAFNKAHSNIKLDLNKVLLKNVSTFLKKGLYDVAIAVDSELQGDDSITTLPLYKGKYSAAVSRTHPLFHYDAITKDQLYQFPLVMLNSNAIGNSYSLMIQHAIEDGYQPNIVRTVEDIETELFHIITDNLIGFFPDNYYLNYPEKEVRLIPIQDTHHNYQIEVGFLKENNNPALAPFLSTIQNWFSQ